MKIQLIRITIHLYWLLNMNGFILCVKAPGSSDQYNIFMNITKNYNKNVRPKDSVEVTPSFSLKQVVSIDEKNQIMTSNSYMGLSWQDERLTWNPHDFNEVNDTLIPTSLLWIIDLFVINTADSNGYVSIPSSSLASVDFNGSIYVVFSLTSLKTRCKMNVKYYPFDSQTCSVINTQTFEI